MEDIATTRLYSNWITGGEPLSLTPYLAEGGNVQSFQITPDSHFVIFHADGLTNNIDELFSIPIEGPWTSTVRISAPMSHLNGDVVAYRLSPDGKKVIYIADADVEGKNVLYVIEDVELLFLPLANR